MPVILGKYAALVWEVYVQSGTSDTATDRQHRPVTKWHTHTHTHIAARQRVYRHTLQYKYNKASTFVIIHFNTVASFPDGAKQYGRSEPPPHSAVTAQITLSSVNLNLATRGVDCCHALWNEMLPQSFDVFYVAKTNLYFIKFQCFLCFMWLFYSFATGS